jgi:hypothetical protein
LELSSGDDEHESLFHCETPVAERSAPGCRIAPSHLIFTEPTLLRAAARFSVTSPLAETPRRRRAWRSQGRNRARQRSSRVDVLFLLVVAFLRRVRNRSSRVAVASLSSSAPPKQYIFPRFHVFFVFSAYYRNSKRADGGS